MLFNETFRYVGEWRAERSAVLEFATTVEGVEIDGVDIIAWDEAGRIVDFKVMARPLKAINLLHRLMARAARRLDARGRERLALQPLVQPRHQRGGEQAA